jgi:hypothetical protein
MTLATFRSWKGTEAFRAYRSDRGRETVGTVTRRTERVLRGTASEQDRNKVQSFISRMKEVDSGERTYGSGSTAVSARTASLRN